MSLQLEQDRIRHYSSINSDVQHFKSNSEINNILFTPKLSESLLIYEFGKYIGKLFISLHMRNDYIPLDCMISQEMI
jgi:hypothetical protein